MECFGLKEEMGIEEVYCIFISIYVLWKSILFVIGKKINDLWKEKFFIKVKNIIFEVKKFVKNRIIYLSFFRGF